MKVKLTILIVCSIGVVAYLMNHSRDSDGVVARSSGEPKTKSARVEFVIEGVLKIARDYNQDRLIQIKNHGPGMATLRLEATSKSDELLVGFVGRGSSEWHEENTTVGIPSGETWQLPLLLHADRSSKKDYEIVVKATQNDGVEVFSKVQVEVNQPKLELSVRWEGAESDLDKARLSQWFVIENTGQTTVSDLSMHFYIKGEEVDSKLSWGEMIEEYSLVKGGRMKVKISPRLFPTFRLIQGELVITGLNQEFRVPYEAKVPDGQSVFVTLSRTTRSSSTVGRRCTNRPQIGYSLPATEGTGGEWTPSAWSDEGGGRGRVSTEDSKDKTPPQPDEEAVDDNEEGGGFSWLPEAAGDEDVETSPKTLKEKREQEKRNLAKESRESEVDDSSFDLMDDNLEDLSEGSVPPNSNGSTFQNEIGDKGSSEKKNKGNLGNTPQLKGKEVYSYVDSKGKKNHVTRRVRDSGTEFLNFGFGIQDGKRKKVPIKISGRISQPVLGPRPGDDGGAMLAYSVMGKDKQQVIEIADAISASKIQIGSGKSDSPALIRNGKNVELYYRENGELKRKTIGPSQTVKDTEGWPQEALKVGRILNAKSAPDGIPELITREPSGVMVRSPRGSKLYDATAADIGFDRAGNRTLALRRPDGRIDALDGSGKVTALVPASSGNSAPTLATTIEGGVRMLFSRQLPEESETGRTGLDAGGSFSMDLKDGKWGAPRRQLMANAPVEEAALITEFKLPYGNAHYKPMNTKVLINGKQVGEMKKKTPSGRYVFPVSPEDLQFVNREGNEKNKVTILAEGIGPGNFHLSERVGLYTRHQLSQESLVATSAEEAERLAQKSDETVRHVAPDLIVASNGYELPRTAKPGDEVEVRLSLFNAGDRPSKDGMLTAKINNRIVGKKSYKSLAPFRGDTMPVKIKLPMDWKKGSSLRMNVQAPTDGDADPTNNDLDFYILKAPSQRITQRQPPVRIDPSGIDPKRLNSITPGTVAQPHEEKLQSGVRWYQMKQGKGKLQVEVVGADADRVSQMNLYDSEGKQVRKSQVKGPLYLRVDAPQSLSKQTKINLWWE